jgi:F1F0 ATPase subunit 2
MEMNDPLLLALPLAGGVVLGAIFFGGLWWTVNRSMTSKHPALWVAVSAPLRTSVALFGFYLVGRDHWQRLALCLVGFVLARLVVTRLARASGTRSSSAAQGTSHAS